MDPSEVIARIHSKIKKITTYASLVLGDIKVDQENLLVYRDNELVELTQTEYRLLILLLRESIDKPGKILDHQDIIEFVWPLDHEKVYPRTLSTHLTNLRKKLNSKSVNFVSIRQEGFCLEIS
jgi:DNA-binding response OmpR family regulator